MVLSGLVVPKNTGTIQKLMNKLLEPAYAWIKPYGFWKEAWSENRVCNQSMES